MKKIVSLSLATVSFTLLSASAWADPHFGDRELEFRVNLLEQQVSELNRSLGILQKRVDELSSFPPSAPVEMVAACMVIDSGYSKTFLGVGKSKLDAEYSARSACQSTVSASFCSNHAQLKCDDNFKPPYARGFVCMVTDSGYSKTFRGVGRTAIEAEARAKQICQSSVSAVYCGHVSARCEEEQ
jgi:hypothetical protein